MIKKRIILIILLLLLIPTSVLAVKDIDQNETLGELKASLKEYEKKQQENKNKKVKTQSEINSNKQKVVNTEKELMEAKENVLTIQGEIEQTNEAVNKLKGETKDLLVEYQKQESENFYISYITSASSMTEFIMRLDAVNKITDYNNEKLNNLELLIKNNKKMSKKLDEYQKELDKKIIAYQASIEKLNEELVDLDIGAVSIADEIANLKDWIKVYEDMGCKDDQVISACINSTNNAKWFKPVLKGKITSLYGYRQGSATVSSYHKGIDIGVAEGTSVYPTANGVVAAVIYPNTASSRCGGKKLYIWTIVNGKKYTYVYMHLMDIKVKVGDKVYTNQVVALSGGGPKANQTNKYSDNCTTGAHLHYGVAEGGWWGSDDKNYKLSYFNSHTINPPGFPGLYQWFYSRN